MRNISIFLGYVLFMLIVTSFTKLESNLQRFTVSDRNIKSSRGALSIAATWIWAPALFVASTQAYLNGIRGFAYFFIPNILSLVLFGVLSMKIRERFPNGYTLPEYMGKKYSGRVKGLYEVEMLILAMCSMGVQLYAGGKIVSYLTGLDMFIVTLLLAGVALLYSMKNGIEASIITDAIQMIILVIGCVVIVPYLVAHNGGIDTISNGIHGLGKQRGLELFVGFGLPTTIGLLAGPVGDQSFWQRAFSLKKSEIRKSYFKGAAIFAVVPFFMAIIGFLAAGSNFIPENNGMVNLEYIDSVAPVMIPLFVLMVICGLSSTIDSNLCSVSSIFIERTGEMKAGKKAMLAITILGMLIANVPSQSITKLFLFYGILRSSVFIPTLYTICSKREIPEKSVFRGILFSMMFGCTVFYMGVSSGSLPVKLIGTLSTMLIPLFYICFGGVGIEKEETI